MALTRRDFTTSLAALALTPKALAQTIAATPTLREAAARNGLLAGTCVTVPRLRDTPEYADLIARQASILVAETEMKFGPIHPKPDTFFFDNADFLLAFAKKHHIQVRGHNFVWHRALPPWFASTVTAANAEQVLVHHIETVAGRYAGRIHSWDVVNEAIHPDDHLSGGLRNSPWQQLLPNYIDIAFRAARRADPHALLCYNDYGIEGEDPGSAAKRAAVLALVRGMRDRNVPIDAVGIQSHLTAGRHYGPQLLAFMAELRALGLKLLLTEMDVNDRELPADIPTRDAAVAKTYSDYLTQTLRDPAVLALLTWGITDRFTWLNHEDNRKDNVPERCLPFDADFHPTPAFTAELEALTSAPKR